MNDRVQILRRRVSVWLAAALACASPLAAADRKPNFLFIYTDDQRWDAMGVVQREQGEQARFPWFKSPNMDRLAGSGVRFRNAFVTMSLCSPSRAAFLTGCYNHINGITNNHTSFPLDSVTHASLLRTAGYKTAYIGKWHMGEQEGQRPGFDYSASFVGHGRYNDCPYEINGISTPTTGWVDDVSTDFAIKWMKENRDHPFSIVVGFKSPHSPRGGKNLPERLRHLYDGETSRTVPNMGVPAIFNTPEKGEKPPQGLADNSIHLDYLRHVSGADENLGRLLDALDELNLTEDTVVVYSSDNGYYLGEHCLGDKRSVYEESLRVPMLARYPRLFGKGQVIDEMVLNIDLAPTFLDLAGVSVPKAMQGVSWKELAAGHKPANWRTSFFAEYFYEDGGGNTPTLLALRTTSGKLVKYPGHKEWTEIYDLSSDRYEIKNLAGNSALTAKLEAEFEARKKEANYFVPANVDKPRPPPDPSVVPVKDEPGLPRVLLIGDSISMGYTLPVRALLKGKANLHRIPTNGGSTKDGVSNIETWLGKDKWDVIHFNWGLHDLKHMKGNKLDITGDQVTTLAEYETNLRTLVTRMKATGAKLIWASTTPVPDGSDGRAARDEEKYNEVAARVMKETGVPIDDLHALCLPKLADWQLPHNVHYKDAGYDGLAAKVAADIQAALK